MKSYRDEPVMAQLVARLAPPDHRFPDCLCNLVLTHHRLFVLEDNFDSIFAEHFVVPLGHIENMEITAFVDKQGAIEEQAEDNGFFRKLCIAFWGHGRRCKRTVRYLKVSCVGTIGQAGVLYFNALPSGAGEFVGAF